MALVSPTPAFNFMVTFWDTPGRGTSALSSVVSAAASVATQMLLGGFSEVSGLDSDLELETYQEGGRNHAPHRLLKGARYSNLVFKRGVSFGTDLADWSAQVLTGSKPVVRKDGIIVLFDRNGFGGVSSTPVVGGMLRLPVAAWKFTAGLPERLHGPQLNARSNEIAIETLEISHEGLQRVSPSMIPGVADVAGSLGF
jgi:phage tail-like protein